MRECFEQLVQAFCRLVAIPDARHVIDGGGFEVDGIPCTLLFNDKLVPDQCFVCADFGQPPADNEAQVFYELLRHNFACAAGTGAPYSVSTLNGHVMCIERFALPALKPETLADAMADIAGRGNDWRKTRFLSADGR